MSTIRWKGDRGCAGAEREHRTAERQEHRIRRSRAAREGREDNGRDEEKEKLFQSPRDYLTFRPGAFNSGSTAEQNPEALAAAQAVNREIPLVDGGDRRNARVLGQVDEGGVRVIAR